MKLLNFSDRELIYQNINRSQKPIKSPTKPSKRQIEILQSIVARKKYTQAFLTFIAEALFGTSDFQKFSYQMMYEYIYVLGRYKTARERSSTND